MAAKTPIEKLMAKRKTMINAKNRYMEFDKNKGIGTNPTQADVDELEALRVKAEKAKTAFDNEYQKYEKNRKNTEDDKEEK